MSEKNPSRISDFGKHPRMVLAQPVVIARRLVVTREGYLTFSDI